MCGAPCINTATNTAGPVTGVTSFSRWTVAEALVPTAAAAGIAGRVLRADGRPIANAAVVLSGGALAEPLTVHTGHLGFFSFTGLPVGREYVLTVKAPRSAFAVPSRLINLQNDVLNEDFIAEP